MQALVPRPVILSFLSGTKKSGTKMSRLRPRSEDQGRVTLTRDGGAGGPDTLQDPSEDQEPVGSSERERCRERSSDRPSRGIR